MDAHDLLTVGELPDAAVRAAALHADLARALVVNAARLPDDVFTALWDGPGRRDADVAAALARHVDRPGRIAHVLAQAGEWRPAVLAALLRHVVPPAGWRQAHADLLHGPVADAVLANPAWPTDEQAVIAGAATPDVLLGWLATQDPEGPHASAVRRSILAARDHSDVEADIVVRTRRGRRRAGTPVEPCRPLAAARRRAAVLRWPEAVPLALRGGGCGARATVVALVDDAMLLADLVGHAERCVDPVGGAPLVEALWCHPGLPGDLRRRLADATPTRPFRPHYVRPVPENPSVTEGIAHADWDDAHVDAVLGWAEAAVDVRHLTVWTVAALVASGRLDGDREDRGLAVLDRHGVAAGLDDATWRWLCERAGHPGRRRRVRGRAARGADGGRAGAIRPVDVDRPSREARRAVRRLTRTLGDHQDAWDVALVLLRDGWSGTADDLAATAVAIAAPAAGSARAEAVSRTATPPTGEVEDAATAGLVVGLADGVVGRGPPGVVGHEGAFGRHDPLQRPVTSAGAG